MMWAKPAHLEQIVCPRDFVVCSLSIAFCELQLAVSGFRFLASCMVGVVREFIIVLMLL